MDLRDSEGDKCRGSTRGFGRVMEYIGLVWLVHESHAGGTWGFGVTWDKWSEEDKISYYYECMSCFKF